MCHVLEIYIWVAMRGLGGIEVKRGLDKNFPQVASVEVFLEEAHFSQQTREMGHAATLFTLSMLGVILAHDVSLRWEV